MKWGFAQGVMGSQHESLAPSSMGLGPNTYLGRNDFFKMLGIALAIHLLIFGIASLFPHQKVNNIPVRALSFKLGDQDRIAAFGAADAGVPTRASIAAPSMSAAHEEIERIAPTTQPIIKWKPTPKTVARTAAAAPVPTPVEHPAPAPAIAPVPQQYVREVGQPKPAPVAAATPSTTGYGIAEGAIGGAGLQSTQTAQTTQEIRERYEQQISSWIERHKFYPPEAGGREGRVVIRMRIDRGGTVRYYAIEESSGIASIDTAAIDMIRRANPVPAVPANYPSGNLIEFLIPITFRVPQ